MLSRVLYPILGISGWQIAYENKNEHQNINLHFVNQLETIVKYTIIGLIVLGVLLDIAILRNRKFSKWIMYYELVSHLLMGFTPLNYGEMRNFFALLMYMQLFIVFSVRIGPNIIVTTAFFLI